MKRRILLALAAAALAAACTPTPNANPLSVDMRRTLTFSEIAVTAEGAAFESAIAADFASRLGPDLEAELRQEFSDRLSPAGARLVVDLARINVSSRTATAYGRDQSRLVGQARIIGAGGETLAVYPVMSIAGEAADSTAGLVVGTVLSGPERLYRQLLDSFALSAREQILGAGLPGARLYRQLAR